MSDTPRTDAAVYLTKGPNFNAVCPNFARELERENAALRAQDAWLVDTFSTLESENQKLRNEISRLNGHTNWLCKCGGTDCAGQKENVALRADKERLDWLIKSKNVRYPFFPADVEIARERIDAARKEAQP